MNELARPGCLDRVYQKQYNLIWVGVVASITPSGMAV